MVGGIAQLRSRMRLVDRGWGGGVGVGVVVVVVVVVGACPGLDSQVPTTKKQSKQHYQET